MIRQTLTVLVSIFILFSCSPKADQNLMDSGTIEYKITYPTKIQSQAFSNILPEEMSVFFTEEELKFKIKGELNLFALEFIARANGDSCFTLFRMPSRKIYSPLSDKERWFLFDKNPPIDFQVYDDSIKNIAGFDCHKVEIEYKTSSNTRFEAYFTKSIAINKNLMRSPFEKIDGIPLQFEIQFNNLTYKFKASKIMVGTGDEKLYVPDDFELTPKDEIQSIICSILQ